MLDDFIKRRIRTVVELGTKLYGVQNLERIQQEINKDVSLLRYLRNEEFKRD